ncbi:hypothetical protein JXI42_03180 [bacterium]|nr:hypothetical protein [bacterium]
METKTKWFIYRILVIVFGSAIGLTGLILGYHLVKSGAMGEFNLTWDIEGWKGFITSVTPGIFFAFMGCVVTIVAFLIQTKKWGGD